MTAWPSLTPPAGAFSNYPGPLDVLGSLRVTLSNIVDSDRYYRTQQAIIMHPSMFALLGIAMAEKLTYAEACTARGLVALHKRRGGPWPGPEEFIVRARHIHRRWHWVPSVCTVAA